MSTRSKERCFLDLQSKILTMELAPGADLEETALASTYSMSRTPLREVLQRLAGDGYVEIATNRGAKVASMDVSTMRTFFQTAPMVYANIARLAAEKRATRQLDALKDCQTRFVAATQAEDAPAAALENHKFHHIIGEMADNPYLMAGLERLLIDHTRLGQTFYRAAGPDEKELIRKAADQHDAMITAFECREAALAIDLTLQHWDLSRDRIERFVRPDPLPVDVVSLKERRHAL